MRGGSSLPTLFEKGPRKAKEGHILGNSSGIEVLLSDRRWDFLCMNDYSQQPAIAVKKAATLELLQSHLGKLIEKYGPRFVTPQYLLQCASSNDQYFHLSLAIYLTRPWLLSRPIVYQTWGYRAPAKGSEVQPSPGTLTLTLNLTLTLILRHGLYR